MTIARALTRCLISERLGSLGAREICIQREPIYRLPIADANSGSGADYGPRLVSFKKVAPQTEARTRLMISDLA